MGKSNFGLNFVAAILKFKIAAYTNIPNVIFTCLIGFLDPENIGIATKIKFLSVSSTDILAKPNSTRTGGGHFEKYFLNDEARVGNSVLYVIFAVTYSICKYTGCINKNCDRMRV